MPEGQRSYARAAEIARERLHFSRRPPALPCNDTRPSADALTTKSRPKWRTRQRGADDRTGNEPGDRPRLHGFVGLERTDGSFSRTAL